MYHFCCAKTAQWKKKTSTSSAGKTVCLYVKEHNQVLHKTSIIWLKMCCFFPLFIYKLGIIYN